MTHQNFSIHAHFYQPPREDPLSGIIPIEDSAAPYANWNERIHAECYRPNAELGNLERISFNLGPTLASWMQIHDAVTLSRVISQDHANLQRHGVGNAMAQAYNHTILPLATYLDKVTQIYWGMADFSQRFGHPPQGIWLPEAAVDQETLDVLARFGIQYTILAPWQAAVNDLDVTEPYRVKTSGGKEITVFFYQRDISALVSFNPNVTTDADRFAREILSAHFQPEKTARGVPQLVMVASDGELYGHHQTQRQFFLQRLVDGASEQIGIQPTYPGLWLKNHPAREYMTIHENTSWSCHHGVVRWAGECGCTSSDGRWKLELRRSLDELAKQIDQIFLKTLKSLVINPWELRNRWIHVRLGQMSFDRLLGEMASKTLTSDQTERSRLLLEAQRERQRMFTSCGWFFDDFDRIEPRNNIAYAAQAVNLVKRATGIDLETQAIEALQPVICPRSRLRADNLFQYQLRRAESSN